MAGPTPCAVFDLDGSLIDSVPHFATILNAMLAERGAAFSLSEAEVRPHATAGGLPMVRGLLRGACGEPDAALAEFRARYAAMATPPSCLFEGVREALVSLRADGIVLGVWSNKPQHLCDKVLADLDLAPLFHTIVGTREGVPLKPDPTGLDLAIAGCGSSRARACFVGDSELDYEGARAADVPFVLLTHGYGDYTREYPGADLAERFSEAAVAVRARLLPLDVAV